MPIHAKECLICGNPNLTHLGAARVAPFLQARCGIPESITPALLECPECQFQFYDQRLDPHEAKALYKGYRGPAYNNLRCQCEPRYLEKACMFDHPQFMKERIDRLAETAWAWGMHPWTVLDFGGGDGWLCKAVWPGAAVYVHEAGDGPIQGHFDLIHCAHVLEHLSFPQETVRELLAHASQVYVEVPTRDSLPPVMHEHISLFRPRSIERALHPHPIVQSMAGTDEFSGASFFAALTVKKPTS